jgi:hypothetical protein
VRPEAAAIKADSGPCCDGSQAPDGDVVGKAEVVVEGGGEVVVVFTGRGETAVGERSCGEFAGAIKVEESVIGGWLSGSERG